MLHDVNKIPKPQDEFENGKLYDGSGHTIPQKTEAGWMQKTDSKLSEKVELSKGTLWLLATGFLLLQLALNYGGSLIGIVRDDQTNKVEVQKLQSDMTGVKEDVKEIKETLHKIEVKEAYKLGAGTAHENEQEKK